MNNSEICKPRIDERIAGLFSQTLISLFCRWPDTVLSMQGSQRTAVLFPLLSLTPVGTVLCPSKPFYGCFIPAGLEQDKYPLLEKRFFCGHFLLAFASQRVVGIGNSDSHIYPYFVPETHHCLCQRLYVQATKQMSAGRVCIFVRSHTQ